jgi:hypothetical protein
MATCAMCQHPILTPQRFVLDGTEVMHRECARTGRTTVLQQTQRDLAAAREDTARIRRSLGERIASLERDLRVAFRSNQQLRKLELERAPDLRAMEIERDAARREAQTLTARAAVTADHPVEGKITPEPEMDPTEQRFSLLELDPL